MKRSRGWLQLAGVVAWLLSACAPGDPLEQVAKTRARYDARLNGFYVTAEPAVGDLEAVPGEEAAEVEAPGPADDEGEVDEVEPEVPVRQSALLDIIVQHDSNTKLPGVTVDIVMVDAAQQEKARWLHWVDTSTLAKANQLQFTYTIDDVPYVEGDGFSVEVRHPVPAAEYGDYREFSLAE